MQTPDFLTEHGWAFTAIREAKTAAECAPEHLRLGLTMAVEIVERQLRDDLTRALSRADMVARRLTQIARAAPTDAGHRPEESDDGD